MEPLPSWVTIFLSLGGSVLIGLIVTLIFNKIVNKINSIKQLTAEKKEKERAAELGQLRQAMAEETKIMKEGVQALLRNDLYLLYYRCKEKHCATFTEKTNFENMYRRYHDMGQNGVMDNVYKQMMKLPLSDNREDTINELSGADLVKYLALMAEKEKEEKQKKKEKGDKQLWIGLVLFKASWQLLVVD